MYETLQHNIKRLNERMQNIHVLRLFGGGGPGGWDLLGWDWILCFIFTSSRNVCQAQTIIDKIKG